MHTCKQRSDRSKTRLDALLWDVRAMCNCGRSTRSMARIFRFLFVFWECIATGYPPIWCLLTKHPGRAMTICDIPCTVNTPSHQTYFPANTKAYFQVLASTLSAGILFKAKTLWTIRLQIELPHLWRQKLPVAIVNFLPFWWFNRTVIIYFKSSNTACLPRGHSKSS